MDKEISDEIIQKILVAYKSYVEDKKPLEYILWHVDFFWKEFYVNEATLIPRPETEYMITAVTEFIKSSTLKGTPSFEGKEDKIEWNNNLLLDIGTGCGVLWISVLLQNPGYFAEAILCDYFANALEVAKINYQKLVIDQWKMNNEKWIMKVSFLQSDLLEFLKSSTLKGTPSFVHGIPFGQIKEVLARNVILVANLPYIPEETFELNAADNVKKREPKPAFVGGDDGLIYYRKMFEQLLELKLNNLNMFLEMMTWQVDVLRQEFGDRFEFEEVKTFHFNIRIVKAWLK